MSTSHIEQHRRPATPARAGNALVAAMIVMSLAAVAVMTTADIGVTTHRQVLAATDESRVLAALDAVLARRQQEVIYKSTNQRPDDFVTWDKNYGVDFIGDVEVRWKIEPSTAARTTLTNVETAAGNPMPSDAPLPGDNGGAPVEAIENRGKFYLYRIAAEARIDSNLHSNASNSSLDRVDTAITTSDRLARAQGVRYVVTPNESSLNYLIYYAQQGPKADLELSHGWPLNLVGDIYTGGAAYFGGGTQVNTWAALRQPSPPTNAYSDTASYPWTVVGPPNPLPSTWTTWSSGVVYQVGSRVAAASGTSRYQCKAAHTSTATNEPGTATGNVFWHDVTTCRVVAVDGVYRLSKQVLYSAVNGFPMSGSVPSGFTLSGSYSIGSVFPGERAGDPPTASYRLPKASASSVFEATWDGTIINPARAGDFFATVAQDPAKDYARQIMGVPLRGVDGSTPATMIGNDSRDRTRTSSTGFVWKTGSVAASAPGFNKNVRTRDNGAGPEELASRFRGRPEEAQVLEYPAGDLDNDPTTEEHEYALPVFVQTNGATSSSWSSRRTTTGVDAIEAPGSYLSKALGPGRYMGRKSDYTGWKILDVQGNDLGAAADPGKVGLVIRERPVPDHSYFTPIGAPGPSDPRYMPYAYGKIRSSLYPYITATVSGNSSNAETGDVIASSTATPRAFRNIDTSIRSMENYEGSATLSFTSGMAPGAERDGDRDYNAGGWDDSTSYYQRFPQYYKDHWRFIHLRKPERGSGSGLTAFYFNDVVGGRRVGPLGGRMVLSRTDANIDIAATSGGPTAGLTNDDWSIRWVGWIKADATGSRAINVYSDDGARVWIDGRQIIHEWTTGLANRTGTFSFTEDEWYPIVVEFFERNGSAECHLQWSSGAAPYTAIPTANLAPATDLAFNWSDFTAVQGRLTNFTGLAGAKAGLMLRPGGGVSAMQDGRDPYVALTYSIGRGIVAQVRGERSTARSGTGVGYYVGNATLTAPGGSTSTLGDIVSYPTSVSAPAVTRDAHLIIEPRAVQITRQPGETEVVTVRTPGKDGVPTHPYNGVTGAPETAFPANSGYNEDWNKVRDLFSLQPDFVAAQGTIRGIRIGPATLRVQKWPRARSRIWVTANWNWRLTDLAETTSARLRWISTLPLGAYPSPWDVPWLGLASDRYRNLVMFADRTGDRIFRTMGNTQTTWNPATTSAYDRRMYQIDNNPVISTTGTDAGARMSRSLDGGTAGATGNMIYWFPDTDANGLSDVSQPDLTKTFTNRQFLWSSKATGSTYDKYTRPGLYNGTDRKPDADLTIEMVQNALSQQNPSTNPADWTAVDDTGIAYPVPTAPANVTYRDGIPTDAFNPNVPEELPAALRLTAAVTAVQTTLTLSHNRMLTAGESLTLHSAAGTEHVRVTGVVGTTQITVDRAVRGSTALAHADGSLVTLLPFPISTLKSSLNGTDATSTMTLYSVPNLGVTTTFNVRAGDVLTIANNTSNNSSNLAGGGTGAVGNAITGNIAAIEQVRVTAVDAVAGTITVLRGVNGTTKRAWTITAGQTFAATDTNLNDGNTNANTQKSPPSVYLGGTVRGVVSPTGGVATAATTLGVVSTVGFEVGDILKAGTEILRVASVGVGQITVLRADGFSTADNIPHNLPLIALPKRTFAVNRDRTVQFEVNSYMTPGATPSAGGGWYWNRVAQFSPWRGAWSNVTPPARTGGFQPRVWGQTQTAPETVQPTIDTPTNVNAAVPGGTLVAATGRWSDDQPASHQTSVTYNAGDVVFSGGTHYACTANGTTTAPPGSGWSQANVWLRIERVTTTSDQVRFLYAVKDTEPVAADWRPVLIDQRTDAAGAPRAGIAGAAAARELRFDASRWFGKTTLAANIDAAATTMTLAGGTWKVGDVLAIDSELVEVTAVSGTTLTITRAMDSSTAAAHTAAAIVTRDSYRGDQLLVGVCANGNKTSSFSSFADSDLSNVRFSNLRIENHNLATTADDYVVDATDWDANTDPTEPSEDTQYLASQYQVFFGPYDITEDFFLQTTPILREDWIYNTREFWSQPRWWEDGTERDPGFVLPNATALSNREIFAKTTLLTLDMRALQDYLRTRTLADATAHRLDGGYTTAASALTTTLRDALPTTGLIVHISRTNRYPWNPELDGVNPWNPGLPNTTAGATYSTKELAALGASARTTAFDTQRSAMQTTLAAGTWNLLPTHVSGRLQPWTLATTQFPGALLRTPPIRPQDFHHGVRLVNGSSIDWDHNGTGGSASGSDPFGTSKMLVVTPNHLYLQGDFNTVAQPVSDAGVACSKSTPIAVYGDSVTFLSNNWNDAQWTIPGLIATATDVTGGGTLAYNQGPATAPVATATTYACAVLTHNTPTTRRRVMFGEAAALDDNLLVLEGWSGVRQTFIGSIVVMDTRRYTDAYRLDGNKEVGMTPFGFIGPAASWTTWRTKFEGEFATASAYGTGFTINQGLVYNGTGASDGQSWGGGIDMICGIPNRELFYNPDFKTKEGTPPEMPFGIKTVGVGGWSKIVR